MRRILISKTPAGPPQVAAAAPPPQAAAKFQLKTPAFPPQEIAAAPPAAPLPTQIKDSPFVDAVGKEYVNAYFNTK